MVLNFYHFGFCALNFYVSYLEIPLSQGCVQTYVMRTGCWTEKERERQKLFIKCKNALDMLSKMCKSYGFCGWLVNRVILHLLSVCRLQWFLTIERIRYLLYFDVHQFLTADLELSGISFSVLKCKNLVNADLLFGILSH